MRSILPCVPAARRRCGVCLSSEAGTRPSGGEDWIPAMAGAMHPPCRRKKLRPLRPRLTARTALCSVPSSSPHAAGRAGAPVFLPEENEKTGRARSKREKEVTGDATGARLNERRSRNDFPRAIRLSGGLSRDEWTSSSFRCRCPGGRKCIEGLPFFSGRPSSSFGAEFFKAR